MMTFQEDTVRTVLHVVMKTTDWMTRKISFSHQIYSTPVWYLLYLPVDKQLQYVEISRQGDSNQCAQTTTVTILPTTTETVQ